MVKIPYKGVGPAFVFILHLDGETKGKLLFYEAICIFFQNPLPPHFCQLAYMTQYRDNNPYFNQIFRSLTLVSKMMNVGGRVVGRASIIRFRSITPQPSEIF